MAGGVVFVALALVMCAGCHGNDNFVLGCAGAAVLVTVTPSPATDAAAPGDGGAPDAKPSCVGACDDYLEALRVAIQGATPATCVRRPQSSVLSCVPSAASGNECARDTVDAATSLESQIRDYLTAAWPELGPAAVVLDTCVCHFD